MNPKRKSRLYLAVFLLVAVAGTTGALMMALEQNINMFYPPEDIVSGVAPADTQIRAGGMVADGSVRRDADSLAVSFVITDHLGADFTSKLKRRRTNIIPLEMAAVLATAHRFRPHLRGHNVCFFIDNTSVLHSLKKGHCRANDINRMVISFADITSNLVNRVAFVWVPSAWNISDWPSRGQPIQGLPYVNASASLKHVKSCL